MPDPLPNCMLFLVVSLMICCFVLVATLQQDGRETAWLAFGVAVTSYASRKIRSLMSLLLWLDSSKSAGSIVVFCARWAREGSAG